MRDQRCYYPNENSHFPDGQYMDTLFQRPESTVNIQLVMYVHESQTLHTASICSHVYRFLNMHDIVMILIVNVPHGSNARSLLSSFMFPVYPPQLCMMGKMKYTPFRKRREL